LTGIVTIDGSMGEGGGQILRTAVALSAIIGTPIRIYNIRAKRKNPGLRPQHLTAVKAIAALSNARVLGATVGSMELYFEPRTLRGGRYEFNVGTAGSISLVLQALLPVLAFVDKPSEVVIRGGTDVPMAPTIDYVKHVLLWHLRQLGYEVELSVLRRGHYPRGGGIVEVKVPDPPRIFKARNYVERGELEGVLVKSHAVRLPRHVAERQASAAVSLIKKHDILKHIEPEIHIESYDKGRDPHLGPGSGVLVAAFYSKTVMGADALGARGKRAELVGQEAARKLIEDLSTGAPLDRHMSDMILVYLALADRESVIWGAKLTLHALTVLDLLRIMHSSFEYEILEGGRDKPFKARIKPLSIPRPRI